MGNTIPGSLPVLIDAYLQPIDCKETARFVELPDQILHRCGFKIAAAQDMKVMQVLLQVHSVTLRTHAVAAVQNRSVGQRDWI